MHKGERKGTVTGRGFQQHWREMGNLGGDQYLLHRVYQAPTCAKNEHPQHVIPRQNGDPSQPPTAGTRYLILLIC